MSESTADHLVGETVDPGRYCLVTVQAPRRLEWVYRDAYRHLGWLLDAFDPDGHRNPTVVTLRFRRLREVGSVPGLAAAQAEVDATLAVIAARERVQAAIVHSSTALCGLVGSAQIALGVLAAGGGDLVTMALLVALGVVTWMIGMLGRRHLAAIARTRFGLGNEQEYAGLLAVAERSDLLLGGSSVANSLDLFEPRPAEPVA